MRLDFNILWVEDQPAAVDAQRAKIESRLRKEGFRLQVEFATSVDGAETFLSADIFGDHVDLILMDYDLGDGSNGGVGIEKVRDNFPFKDIIFYSASGVQKLQESVTAGKFQGVFCSSRPDLPDTVVGVFEALVKKVVDIDHSRGIVMGATSEIDYFINDSLLNAFAHGGDKTRAAALKIVEKHLGEIRKTFEKESKKIEAAKELSDLFALHHVYTSAYRLRLLRKLLETKGTHAAEVDAMRSYADETVPKRNALAHLKVERKGFSRKLCDAKGVEFSTDDMRALRVALLDHHEVFDKVAASLKPATAPKAGGG